MFDDFSSQDAMYFGFMLVIILAMFWVRKQQNARYKNYLAETKLLYDEQVKTIRAMTEKSDSIRLQMLEELKEIKILSKAGKR